MEEEGLLSLFHPELRTDLDCSLLSIITEAEEIRLRIGYPVFVMRDGSGQSLGSSPVKPVHLDYLFERATSASVHSFTDQIQNGYVFTESGYRVGICGSIYGDRSVPDGIRDLTSVSIRIPHAIRGCADKIYPELITPRFLSTLIMSPPGYGKTTLLRELIRKLSSSGIRVSVADERGEIAAIAGRRAAFDLGSCTDVMTGGEKHTSAMMLLRAMNPQILAFDEITDKKDLKAIMQLAGCGVELLAAVHAADRNSMRSRALYRKVLDVGVFKRAVRIQMLNHERIYAVEELS